MNCNDYQQLMADALGGESDPASLALLERHVAGCATCCVEYVGAQKALRTMQSLSEPPSVAVFRSGEQLIIQPTRATNARRLGRVNVWLRYAACILIAFIAGYFVAASRSPDPLHTVVVERPQRPTPNVHPKSASLESAIVSVHERHPNESPLTKCLLAMATSVDRKMP